MRLKAKLLCYTAAVLMTAGTAFAAIDGNALADSYLAKGYDFVEVKVGPTQTKVEAIKGTTKVEVIYDNETQEIIKSEQETAEGDEVGRTGKQVRTVNRDFERDDGGRRGGRGGRDDDDDDDDRDDDDSDDDDSDDDDRDDDDSDDDDRDDNDRDDNDDDDNGHDDGDDGDHDDNSGKGGGGDDD